MSAQIIIILCILLLLAYIFDLTSSKTKVPSVILLLALGWIVRQIAFFLDVTIPDLSVLLPSLGTIGLILIVLEGSLELEFEKSKIKLIKKSFLAAFGSIFIMAFIAAFVLSNIENVSFKDGLLNVIPLCIISSAIAIPSAKNLSKKDKEFVIYESSLSDILGVVFFNFILINNHITIASVGGFVFQLIMILVISFLAIVGLSLLLSHLKHHIKFVPIIILVVLIYEISKIYHLPALIFILLFGLFLGNIDKFKNGRWIQKMKPEKLNEEVYQFKEIVIEATFLIRASFFLLFGFLIGTQELLNVETFIWALGIVLLLFAIRVLVFRVVKIKLLPLLFFAPRGLITILLFLTIIPERQMQLINKSLIIQVVILTALVMMLGTLLSNNKATEKHQIE